MIEYRYVLDLAIKTFGAENQIRMVFEEMSELQKALCKYLRGEKNVEAIEEEIADVEIMLDQMKILFNCEYAVSEFRRQKTGRLEDRIWKEKSERNDTQ